MRYILSAANRRILSKFASLNTLVALDFDGTLAPIVHDRDRASLRPSTRHLLAGLAGQYPCVVLSGRTRSDVQARLGGTGIKTVIGNHGIEPWSISPAWEKAVRSWLPLLSDGLKRFHGVSIEDKRFSVAVHYRAETRKQEVRHAIRAVARALGAVRLIGGKQVINILPANAPHKGHAFERQLDHSRCKRAIYIGDDDTDEDVFALPNRQRILTVRVGKDRDSLAGYYLRNQREIDRLIRLLLELRSGRRVGPGTLVR
ncbi:MAG: trehalose-phosphatase [Gammaproteobacteria bacterium]|nr:trehalose-phosphatase [Gammaproteobacteria bacterium]